MILANTDRCYEWERMPEGAAASGVGGGVTLRNMSEILPSQSSLPGCHDPMS